MIPEEQYVQCMDAAYAAADKETCLKMMRRAEGVLRGEFSAQPTTWRASAGELKQNLRKRSAALRFEMGDTGIEPVTISL